MSPGEKLQVEFDDTGDGTWKPRYVDGQELPNWETGPDMTDYIRSLMNQGWSVIAGVGDRYLFERSD
jgi:hypothetical protein